MTGGRGWSGLPKSTEILVSKKYVSETGKNFPEFTKAGLSPRRKSGGTGCGCSGLYPGHLLRGNAAADGGPGGIKKARSLDRACAVHGYPRGQPPEERNGPRLNKIAHPRGEVKPPDNFRTTAGQGRAIHGPLVLALRRRIQWESGGGGKREAVRRRGEGQILEADAGGRPRGREPPGRRPRAFPGAPSRGGGEREGAQGRSSPTAECHRLRGTRPRRRAPQGSGAARGQKRPRGRGRN